MPVNGCPIIDLPQDMKCRLLSIERFNHKPARLFIQNPHLITRNQIMLSSTMTHLRPQVIWVSLHCSSTTHIIVLVVPPSSVLIPGAQVYVVTSSSFIPSITRRELWTCRGAPQITSASYKYPKWPVIISITYGIFDISFLLDKLSPSAFCYICIHD